LFSDGSWCVLATREDWISADSPVGTTIRIEILQNHDRGKNSRVSKIKVSGSNEAASMRVVSWSNISLVSSAQLMLTDLLSVDASFGPSITFDQAKQLFAGGHDLEKRGGKCRECNMVGPSYHSSNMICVCNLCAVCCSKEGNMCPLAPALSRPSTHSIRKDDTSGSCPKCGFGHGSHEASYGRCTSCMKCSVCCTKSPNCKEGKVTVDVTTVNSTRVKNSVGKLPLHYAVTLPLGWEALVMKLLEFDSESARTKDSKYRLPIEYAILGNENPSLDTICALVKVNPSESFKFMFNALNRSRLNSTAPRNTDSSDFSDTLTVGDIVIRGPHWKWQDQVIHFLFKFKLLIVQQYK
jgi:hypothetical protein